MDKSNTMDHLAHQQWLLNHGFINDLHKDNLYGYGSLIHKEVSAVYVKIDHTNKKVDYSIYVTYRLLTAVSKYNKLRDSDSMWGMWRFKRFLKKEGNLNFSFIINKFVQDYCGQKWSADLQLFSIREYKDDLEHEKVEQEKLNNPEGDQPTDG